MEISQEDEKRIQSLIEKAKEKREVKINVLRDLGPVNKFVGYECLFEKHKVIEVDAESHLIASRIATSFSFKEESLPITSYFLMVISTAKAAISQQKHSFFIASKRFKMNLILKHIGCLLHPDDYAAREREKEKEKEKRHRERDIDELQEEVSELRKRSRKLEEENRELRNDLFEFTSRENFNNQKLNNFILSFNETRTFMIQSLQWYQGKISGLEQELTKEAHFRSELGRMFKEKSVKITPKEEGEISNTDQFLAKFKK